MEVTTSSVGVFTTDRDLVVRSWDPWLAEATGVPATAAVGQSLAALFPDIADRGLLARLKRVATDGVVDVLAPAFHRYLIPCVPRVSSVHFTTMQQHVTLSPLRSDGAIEGVVVTIEDVTARLIRERELAAQLASHDEAIRLRAAQALAAHDATPGAESTPALAAALADESWRVRRAAARGLARGRGDEVVHALLESIRERHRDPAVMNAALQALTQAEADVVPAVIELLAAPDADVRTYAALALGQLRDSRAIPVLRRALEDPDTNVRYHAIEALGSIGAREAAEPIAAIAESRDFFLAFAAFEALGAIAEPSVAARLLPLLDDPALRANAAEALGRFGSEDVVMPIAALLGEPGVPAAPVARALALLYDRFEAAYGEGALVADLARAMLTPESARALTAALPTASDAELGGLSRVLSWLDFDGVDRVLAPLLAHQRIRRPVAEMLAARGPIAVEALVDVLSHADDEARKAAAMALGRIGSPTAVEPLLGLLHENVDVAVAAAGALGEIGDRSAFEPLLALLDRPEPPVRQAAVSALSSIGHPDMPDRIPRLLDDASPRVRESAARIAGYFGYAQCLEPMLTLARSDQEPVRRVVVEHLASFEAPRAVATILHALTADVPGVRAAAARALAHVAAADAIPALQGACTDEDFWVRYYAARSLGRHGRVEVMPALLDLAQHDAVPPVRIAAIDAVGEIGGDERAVHVLGSFVTHDDPAIAAAAITALGAIRTPAGLEPLLRALEADDPDRRLAALEALSRRAAAAAVPSVLHLAHEDPDRRVRERAVDSLARIASPDAVAALIGLAEDGRRRTEVTAALSTLGPEHVPWIGRGLEHRDPGVRCTVVEALSRMRHPAATPLLVSTLDDPAPSVRVAATQALSRLDRRRSVPSNGMVTAAGRHDAARWIGRDERAGEAGRA